MYVRKYKVLYMLHSLQILHITSSNKNLKLMRFLKK